MTKSAPPQNSKVLGWVGLGLLLMGFGSFGLVYVADAPDLSTVRLAAGVGVLTALGVSTILISALRRLEDRIEALEQRGAP